MSARMEEIVTEERSVISTQENGLQAYHEEVNSMLSELDAASKAMKIFMSAPGSVGEEDAVAMTAQAAELASKTQVAMNQASGVQQKDEAHLATKPLKRRRLNRELVEKNIAGLLMMDIPADNLAAQIEALIPKQENL